ncbi:MAG: tyrosine-type recombinase/integrase [Lachnospiraceae bacterium]|nr:tyrosine-type recombinase/integrase [Lachnospiraceae bacterium]
MLACIKLFLLGTNRKELIEAIACDKAGIRRFSMHVLRHTMASRCIEGGMCSKTLQIILGHSNVGITMDRYVHVTKDEKFKEVERIESALKIV